MRNYLPHASPGDVRRRAVRIIIDNPEQGTPAVHWTEEDSVLTNDGSKLPSPADGFSTVVDQPCMDRQYALLHPDTGQVLGEFTGHQLILMFQSFYVAVAKDRDTRVQAVAVPD